MSSNGDSTTGKCFQGQCLNVLSLLSAVGTETIIADRRRDCVDNPTEMTNTTTTQGVAPPAAKSATIDSVPRERRPVPANGEKAEKTVGRRRPCGKECHHGDGPCVRRVRPVSLVKAKKPVDQKERRQQMSTFQKINSGTSKHVHRCAKHLRCNCKIERRRPRRQRVNYNRVSVVDSSGTTHIAPKEPRAMRERKARSTVKPATKRGLVLHPGRYDVLASLDDKFEPAKSAVGNPAMGGPTKVTKSRKAPKLFGKAVQKKQYAVELQQTVQTAIEEVRALAPPAVVVDATAVRSLRVKAQRTIDSTVGTRQISEVKGNASDSEGAEVKKSSPEEQSKESEVSSKTSTELEPYKPAPKPESHARFVAYVASKGVKEEDLDWPTRKLWLDEWQSQEILARDNEKEKQRREFSLELESFKAALRGISVRVNRARLLPGTLALANGTKIKASAINQNSSVSGSCTKTMKKSFETVSKGTSLSTSAAGGGGFFVYVSAGVSKGSSNNKSAQSGCQVIDNDEYDLLCRSGVLVEQEYTVSSWDGHTVLLGDSHMVTFSAGQALWLASHSQQVVCLHGELFFIEKPELLTIANSTQNLAKGISGDQSLKLPPLKDLLTVAVSPMGDLKVAAKSLMTSRNLSKESKAYYEALKKERAASEARSTLDLEFQKFAHMLGAYFERVKPSKGGESWPDWTLRHARAGNFKKLESKLHEVNGASVEAERKVKAMQAELHTLRADYKNSLIANEQYEERWHRHLANVGGYKSSYSY